MMKQFDFEEALAGMSAKEPYLYPQPEGLVSVQDYVFTDTGAGRCVLIRWTMEAEFAVDAFTFELQMLDAVDACLDTLTLTYSGADIPPVATGEHFVPASAIAVPERCASVRIQLLEVTSGSYVYRVKGTRVEAGYRAADPWKYDPRGGRKEGLSDKVSLRADSKCRGRVGLRWPATFLAVLLLLLVVLFPYILPYIRPLFPRDEEPSGEETGTVAVTDVFEDRIHRDSPEFEDFLF